MNNKKILALVLAFTMIFSSMTTVFASTPAATTIGADAAALKTMGVLQGDNAGVTPAYLAKETTRMQAAIMFLRLKGLEDEAMAFPGTSNFADANTMTWAQGKAMMAYLKANPQLGWVGADGGKFNPLETITVNQYYKVMLEALGYKQNTTEVVGDFSWNDVMTFAASKGLVKVAGAAKFTNNDVAIATIEALKTSTKGTTTTLATTMVDAGMINKDAAIAAGLYEAATTAKASAVMAVANNKVEVTFDAAVAKAFAENAANYKVVVKGSTTALEVKSAVAESDSIVVLETAAQTAGTAYSLTVGNITANFTGIAKQAAAPEIDGNVVSIDNNLVEIVFTKAMDKASAEDVANYTLNNGATVKSAKLDTNVDDTRKTVRLTTEGIAASKVYKVKVQNVKSSDMVAIKTVEKSFTGKLDTKAPTIKTFSVSNNQRLKVAFTDEHGINKTVAGNAANYSITSGANTLNIVKVEVKSSAYKTGAYDYDYVEITTDPMTAGVSYTLTMSNLVDASTGANAITKPLTKDFKGVSVDTTAPKATTVTPVSDNKVEIVFDDTNRLDNTTLTDIANYVFDKDITVLSAEILRSSRPDEAAGKTVTLTTSAMELNKSYKLSISNITDEFGNVMNPTTRTIMGAAEDVLPPFVKSADWSSLTEVVLYFNEKLDANTTNDPANYTINNGMGSVLKAELSANGGLYNKVILTTAKQDENTSYTVTINNLKDRQGNAVTNAKAYFVSRREGADTTRPEIVAIDVLSKSEVRVLFNEKVQATSAGFTLSGSALTGSQVGQLLDDGKTVVFQVSATGFTTNNEYKINALTGVKDLANNSFVIDAASMPSFYGVTSNNETAEVSTIEQIDMKTIKVTFTEPVNVVDGSITSTGTAATFNAVVDADDDNDNIGESTVTLTSTSNIAYDSEYKFNFTSEITDYMGDGVKDLNETVAADTTDFRSYVNDEEKAYIDYVEGLNEKSVVITYNEDIDAAHKGAYKVQDADGKDLFASTKFNVAWNSSTDKTKVKITLNTSDTFKADTTYKLVPVVGAWDIAGNTSVVKDVEFMFVGSAVKNGSYIKGVEVVDATHVAVYASEKFGLTDTIMIAAADGINVVNGLSTAAQVGTAMNTKQAITLKKPLLDGVAYTVTLTRVDGTSELIDPSLTYTLTGIAVDGGITVNETTGVIEFSGMNTTDYVVQIVYFDGGVEKRWTVTPTTGADRFDGNTSLLSADVANGSNAGKTQVDLFADYTKIAQGNTYTVEVYRANTSSTIGANDVDYRVSKDDAILYSRELTRE